MFSRCNVSFTTCPEFSKSDIKNVLTLSLPEKYAPSLQLQIVITALLRMVVILSKMCINVNYSSMGTVGNIRKPYGC